MMQIGDDPIIIIISTAIIFAILFYIIYRWVTWTQPLFEVYSVRFYGGVGSIPLKDHITDDYIHNEPEWIKDTRNEPAAYVKGSTPWIRVRFKKLVNRVDGEFQIWAFGPWGATERNVKFISPQEGEPFPIDEIMRGAIPFVPDSGLSMEVFFAIPQLSNQVGRNSMYWRWIARNNETDDMYRLGDTSHTICTTWQQMQVNPENGLEDWVYKDPMLWTSTWAAGKDNEKEICDVIITNLHASGLTYGKYAWSVRDILMNGGGMCGGWYKMFQHLAHCQGVFIHRRCYLVDVRYLPHQSGVDETNWLAINIRSPGLNLDEVPQVARTYRDDDTEYPIKATTPITQRTEKRWTFYGPGDGHCINLLPYQGKVYLYDASFGTGPFELEEFTGAEAPLPPTGGIVLGGAELTSFKTVYLQHAVDYMMGGLVGPDGTPYLSIPGITVRTQIIPETWNHYQQGVIDGITFRWY